MSPFEEIVAGQRQASIVAQTENCMAIMDIHPITRGHTIVFPKKHYATLMDAPSDVVNEITLMVQRLAQGMQEALDCDGMNIFSNNGKAAQQTIFHFSFHIIPRWHNDNIRMLSRDSQLSSAADVEELESVAQQIKSKVKL